MTEEEINEAWGFKPSEVGSRHRGYWIIDEVELEEEEAGARIGDLCVQTRDGSSDIDCEAMKIKGFVGMAEGDGDRTFRYYYFRRQSNQV